MTAKNWSRRLDPGVPMFGRPAEQNRAIAEVTVSTLHPSACKRDLDCYLEYLFVVPNAPGEDAGEDAR